MKRNKKPPSSQALPQEFEERLRRILPSQHYAAVLKSFSQERRLCVRLNPLKQSPQKIKEQLRVAGLGFQEVPWAPQALLLEELDSRTPTLQELLDQGWIYIQGLSSQLVPMVLDPQPGERILDLCAAPGSKTTQIAAMTHNTARITAVEAIKNRFYKLKSVTCLLGAENIDCRLMDGRRFRSDDDLFDRVLVDAPCSSEGRFSLLDKKTWFYWSLRKIREMRRKQRGLLLNASRCLKPGGTLVYSTCTFAPEENEGVIDWVLRKAEGTLTVVPIELKDKNILIAPPVQAWAQKSYSPEVNHTLRILPHEPMEGFFIAKLIKKG